MQGYFERGDAEMVVFDMFFRSNPNSNGYSIAAGLEQVINYQIITENLIIQFLIQ